MYNTSTPMPTHQLSDSNRRIMGSHNDNRARNLRVYQAWKGNNVIPSFQLVSPFPFTCIFSPCLYVFVIIVFYVVRFSFCFWLLPRFVSQLSNQFTTFLPTKSVKIICPQVIFFSQNSIFFSPFQLLVFLQPNESLCNLKSILVIKCFIISILHY